MSRLSSSARTGWCVCSGVSEPPSEILQLRPAHVGQPERRAPIRIGENVPNVRLRLLPDFLSYAIDENDSASPIEPNDDLQVSLAVQVVSDRIIDASRIAPVRLPPTIEERRIDSPALIASQKAVVATCV